MNIIKIFLIYNLIFLSLLIFVIKKHFPIFYLILSKENHFKQYLFTKFLIIKTP